MAEIFLYPQDRSEQYLVKMAHLGRRVGALERHPHRYAELMVALEGQVVDIIDDRAHYTEAGNVYVLYPGMLHEQRDARRGYRYAIFKFEQEELMAEAGHLRSLPPPCGCTAR